MLSLKTVMVAEVPALGETAVCSGEAELLLFKYCSIILGSSYSSKGLFVGTAPFTVAAFSTVRRTQAVPEIPCVPGLSSFDTRCQPSWHTNEPARRCTECTNKQLASV